MNLRFMFRFRAAGRDHHIGDAHCPGCESVAGKYYPRMHADFESSCLGFIHVETIRNPVSEEMKLIYRCDVCNGHPQ